MGEYVKLCGPAIKPQDIVAGRRQGQDPYTKHNRDDPGIGRVTGNLFASSIPARRERCCLPREVRFGPECRTGKSNMLK